MITESAKPESAENGRPELLFGCLFCCNLNICGHDGIGRHARFRFSCSNALGFESPCPHHQEGTKKMYPAKSPILSGFFAAQRPFFEVSNS